MYDWVLKKKGISQTSNDSSVKKENVRKSDDKLQINLGLNNLNSSNNNNNINNGNNKESGNNNNNHIKKKNSLENF